MCRLRTTSILFLLYAVFCLASNNHRHRPSLRPRALIRTGRSQLPAIDRSYSPSLSPVPHYSRHIICRHQPRRLQIERAGAMTAPASGAFRLQLSPQFRKAAFQIWPEEQDEVSNDSSVKLENIAMDAKIMQEQTARFKLQLLRTFD